MIRENGFFAAERRVPMTALMLAVLLLSPAAPRSVFAAAVSPVVVAAARGTPEEATLRANAARYDRSHALGVDRVYPQFALDMAKYPRGGVAHRNVLVVLADFNADAFGPAVHPGAASTPGYYHKLLFSDDPNDGIISMREYYRINSHGRLIISGQVTPGWITMPHSYAYYVNGQSGLDFAGYPRSAQKLAEDAMAAAYGTFGQNLSYFDNDGPDGIPSSGDDDGYIDAVLVIHPGQGAEIAPVLVEADVIWSHESGINVYSNCPPPSSPGCLPGMILGNVRGFLYFMCGEFNSVPGDRANGTYFHEFGHTLGLPDLYEQSACGSSIGTGLGFFSLMAYGNYLPVVSAQDQGRRPGNLDAWCRQFLGFEQPAVVSGSGSYTLAPPTRGGSSLKVWKDGQPGSEYFLVENRQQEGPDQYLPGQGVLIYHVDDTLIDNCRDCDLASCSDPPAPHYRVALVQADGLTELESPSANYGEAADFFPGTLGVTSWTQSTTPDSRSYSGLDTGIRMANIAVGTAGVASFDLSVSIAPDIQVQALSVDDGIGGNGLPDNGESISLGVTLRNVGSASGALSLTLSTTDVGITVGGGGASTAPAMSAGGIVSVATPFSFTIGTYATLPHAVDFVLHWSDGSSSGSIPFTLTVGMGAGLAASFDVDAGTWTTEAVSSTVDEWHLSTTRAYGGSGQSMKVGSTLDPQGLASNEAKSYASGEDAALVSPMFQLAPNSQLAFYSWIDAETNGGTEAWDGGRVEIALRGGPWIPLAVDGGYGYQITYSASTDLRGSDAFSGSPQRWRRVVADLSGYSGPAQVRFRFASNSFKRAVSVDGALFRYYEGWYVDEVAVGPRVDPSPTSRVVSLRGGPNPFVIGSGFQPTMNLRFSAPDGLAHPGLTPQVRIYNLAGRLVRTLDASPDALIQSEFRANWDARNDRGDLAASGIYFAKVDVVGKSQKFRIVLLR